MAGGVTATITGIPELAKFLRDAPDLVVDKGFQGALEAAAKPMAGELLSEEAAQ